MWLSPFNSLYRLRILVNYRFVLANIANVLNEECIFRKYIPLSLNEFVEITLDKGRYRYYSTPWVESEAPDFEG